MKEVYRYYNSLADSLIDINTCRNLINKELKRLKRDEPRGKYEKSNILRQCSVYASR